MRTATAQERLRAWAGPARGRWMLLECTGRGAGAASPVPGSAGRGGPCRLGRARCPGKPGPPGGVAGAASPAPGSPRTILVFQRDVRPPLPEPRHAAPIDVVTPPFRQAHPGIDLRLSGTKQCGTRQAPLSPDQRSEVGEAVVSPALDGEIRRRVRRYGQHRLVCGHGGAGSARRPAGGGGALALWSGLTCADRGPLGRVATGAARGVAALRPRCSGPPSRWAACRSSGRSPPRWRHRSTPWRTPSANSRSWAGLRRSGAWGTSSAASGWRCRRSAASPRSGRGRPRWATACSARPSPAAR